jgi:hypothetical protein
MQSVRFLDDEKLPITIGQDTVDSRGNSTGIKLDAEPTITVADPAVISIADDTGDPTATPPVDPDPNKKWLVADGPLASATIVTFAGVAGGVNLPLVNLAVEIDAGAPAAFTIAAGGAVKQTP